MQHFDPERETSIPTFERVDLMDQAERADLIHMIDFARRNRKLHEALYQLHKNGPVWDGDLISKADCGNLTAIGAAAKVTVKGEQGFNACTYFGCSLLRIFDWLHGEIRPHPAAASQGQSQWAATS